MAKGKERKSISDLLGDLNKRRVETTPVRKYQGDPGARVLNALRDGEKLVVLKPMTFDGQQLAPGDELAPDKVWWPKIAKLAEHEFVRAASEQGINLLNDALVKFLQKQVDPCKMVYTQRKNEANKAREEVILQEQRLKDAQLKLQDAMILESDAEQKLHDLLTGEDATKLLNSGGAE